MTSIDQTATRRQAALPFGHTPLPDLEFALARETVAHFKPPELRRPLSAMLLLARGAGASADDLRYVEGTDVSLVPHSGTWVEIRRPGHERRVPVLVKFADELRQLARQARSGALLGNEISRRHSRPPRRAASWSNWSRGSASTAPVASSPSSGYAEPGWSSTSTARCPFASS